MNGRFKQMEEYLADVPGGLAAYPDYLQKASIYRQIFSRRLRAELAPQLPPALGKLLSEPLPVSAWLPEVHVNALMIVLYDVQGYTEPTWVANGQMIARRLFQGPLYRALMMVVSPSVIINRARSRWEAMHRGIELSARMLADGHATIRISYPRNLVPRVAALSYMSAFYGALEASGAREPICSLDMFGAEVATYDVTWGGPRSSRRSQ